MNDTNCKKSNQVIKFLEDNQGTIACAICTILAGAVGGLWGFMIGRYDR